MSRFLPVILFGLLITACWKKVQVPAGDVISGFKISNDTLKADGVSLDTLTVNLNPLADADKRYVLFKASGGSFVGGQLDTISVEAFYFNNILTATTFFIAPPQPGTIYFTVSPQTVNSDIPYNYTIYDSMMVLPSVPVSIDLTPSSYGIDANYQSQITLTAVLKNNSQKPVSIGNNVLFEDYLLDGTPLHGRYTSLLTQTDTGSSASAVYSVGNIAVGSTFYIKATVLGSNNLRTMIADSVLVTVIQ